MSDGVSARQVRLENGIESRISHFIKREGLSLFRKFKTQGYTLYFSEIERVCRLILEENVYSGVYIKPNHLKQKVYAIILDKKIKEKETKQIKKILSNLDD
jgi:hypothetical protein